MPKKFPLEMQQKLVGDISLDLSIAKESGDVDALGKTALTSVLKVVGKRENMKLDQRNGVLQAFKNVGFEPKRANEEDIRAADTAHKYAAVIVGDLLQDIKDAQLTVHVTSNKYKEEKLEAIAKTYENKPHLAMSGATFPDHYTTNSGSVSSFLNRTHGRS